MNMTDLYRTAFLDPGGTLDDYFLTMTSTDVKAKKIYVTGAMHWLLNDRTGITFAKISNDIAKLHLMNKFHLIGCEINNYGRSEIQSLRREYHMKLIGINTVGKATSEKILQRGLTLDKHQMIRWTNSWRQNSFDDPDNEKCLGQVFFPVHKTPEIRKIVSELDTFIVEKPNLGGTPNPKYHADGDQHDDGVLSLLGNLFIVKERLLRISGFDVRTVGGRPVDIPAVSTHVVGRGMGGKTGNSVYDRLKSF